MRILFLAPQPFFVERGTPIAVKLALQVLGARGEAAKPRSPIEVDLLTYHEGAEVCLPSVHHYRISAPRFLNAVGPGLSVKKLLCDILFLGKALQLVLQSVRAGRRYRMVHAVEEAVFVALLARILFGVPYIYDMDSNLAGQIVEKFPALRFLGPILRLLERMAVRFSVAVVPVCDSLAEIATRYGARQVRILRDVSLLNHERAGQGSNLRAELGLPCSAQIVLYVGNLEKYQGIDLLLESFARVAGAHVASRLVIIGGVDSHIAKYKARALELGIDARAHFLGPKPVGELDRSIMQADVLVSPRIKGENTPMKIYSYLHSGRAILATELRTHTQVLDSTVAMLCHPTPEAFSAGLSALLSDFTLREQLGARARHLAEESYTFEVFSRRLNETYDEIIAHQSAL